MFGYVIPNQGELKVRELEEYRAWYCGLCQRLQKDHGILGRISLNYDMTFLALCYLPCMSRTRRSARVIVWRIPCTEDASMIRFMLDMRRR